jgi:hypothetical protein
MVHTCLQTCHYSCSKVATCGLPIAVMQRYSNEYANISKLAAITFFKLKPYTSPSYTRSDEVHLEPTWLGCTCTYTASTIASYHRSHHRRSTPSHMCTPPPQPPQLLPTCMHEARVWSPVTKFEATHAPQLLSSSSHGRWWASWD